MITSIFQISRCAKKLKKEAPAMTLQMLMIALGSLISINVLFVCIALETDAANLTINQPAKFSTSVDDDCINPLFGKHLLIIPSEVTCAKIYTYIP